MRNCFAAGLDSSREGWDFKNISEARFLIACQSASSEGHLIVSGINYALETLPLLHFLFVGLPSGIDDSARFCDNITDYVSVKS